MGFFKKIETMEDKSPEQSSGELADLRKATEVARIPKTISALASRELDRLERMDPGIPEYSIGVSYLEFLVSLPWQTSPTTTWISRWRRQILSCSTMD